MAESIPNPSYEGLNVDMETPEPKRKSTIVELPSGDYVASINTRQRTPEFAVERFDGEYDMVSARNVVKRRCGSEMINFALIMCVLTAIIIVCICMLIISGGVAGNFWENLLTFSLGVLIPGPKYKRK